MSFPPPTAKQAHIIWMALTGLAVAAIVALVAGAVWSIAWVVNVFANVLWPLAVAGVIAYLLDPVVNFLERRKVPRTRAVAVVFAVAFLLVLGVTGSVIPRVVGETQELQSKIPAFSSNLQQKVKTWIENPPAPLANLLHRFLQRETPPAAENPADTNAPPTMAAATTNTTAGATTNAATATGQPDNSLLTLVDEDTMKRVTGWMGEAMREIGAWLKRRASGLTSFFGVLAGLALIPIYAFYFLVEKRGIAANWQDYLPVKDSRFKHELAFVLDAINGYLIAFFRGQVLVAICDGVLYTIGFSLIGLPYAVLIGVMATFITIIPFIGAIITCATALVISIVAFGDWKHPLLVLAVFAVVQALEGFVIQPKIMGERVGLHPVVIIVALMVGTTLLGGILGGVLAIPLAAALRVIMLRYIWKTPDPKKA